MSKALSFSLEKKDLLRQMVISKLKVSQKELMLGYFWWILDPLLLMLIYWLLIGVIFNRGGPLYPLFILCGLVPHRAFSISFSNSITSISGAFGIIGQVNFPRHFLPLSDVLVNHVKLLFGLLVVVVLALFFGLRVDYTFILLVIPVSIQVILVSGLAMLMSVLGVYFRDLKNLTQFLMRILLYLSPVLYSVDRIPERFRDIYLLNPLASLYVTYRSIIMEQGALDPKLIMISLVEGLLFFFVGYLVFVRQERKLLKYV